MGERKGQFYLSASKESDFFDKYTRLIESKTPICLAEKQDEYVPLLGDIDIKVPAVAAQTKTRYVRTLYTSEEVVGVVRCFQDAVRKNVLNCTNNSLICVVLEKKPYFSQDHLKNGFHLHFPFLFLEKEKVKNVLIPRIKDLITLYKLGNGSKLFSEHTDNAGDLVDDVTSKCWLMYGSSKAEDKKPYVVTEVYDHDTNTLDLYDAFTKEALYTKDEEPIIVSRDTVRFLLPQLLSVSSIKKSVFNVKTPSDLKITSKTYLKQKLKDIADSPELIKKNLIQAKELLKILKPSRVDDYNSWWDIGIILFNIGHGCEEAFTLWDKWSQRSSKYDEDSCLEKWASMERRDARFRNAKGLGSLRWYAKQDNAGRYIEFVERKHGVSLEEEGFLESVLNADIMTTDAPLARLMLDLYSSEYVFSDNGWYEFNGIIWSHVKVMKEFRYKFEDLSKKYKQIKSRIINLLFQDDNDSGQGSDDDDEQQEVTLTKRERAILTAKKQDICKAVNKLENFASQNGVIKMCEILFYNEDFSELLDENSLIIAFKNGVFDFETLTFRKGVQSDYISKTLSIKYDESLTSESREVKDLQDFLCKICPDKSVRRYFVDQTCEVFRGGNRDKIAMFWTGNGNNGKSVTQRLFETMMGKKLAIKLSTSVLTERIQPGNPNPQITRLRGGVRWGVFDEWGKTEQILSGSLNVLTGGDSLPCRDLFQKGSDSSDFTPMFKILCICNELPCLKDAVDATWDRIRIIPFESKFVPREKCPSTLKEQMDKKIFLCDTEITQKPRMEALAKALGWYLIQTFIKKETARRAGTYQVEIPDKVNDAKLKYQAKCDILAFFMEDTYIKTDNDSHKISFDDMYISFKGWYINSFSGKMINLNKHEFTEMVKQKYGLSDADKFLKGYNWNRKYDDEDDD
jgi:phage/plasmid-associated DNA primase